MDQNKQQPTLEESIKEVMQTLPPPIRRYLSQGKYSIVAKSLMSKYALRIDQGGVLEREIMLLLMGIENPDEFAASLRSDAALSEDIVRSIMTDVNQEVFIPLRKEMQSAGSTATEAKPKPLPTAPQVSAPAAPSYAPPIAPRPPASLATAPLPPKMAMPGAGAASAQFSARPLSEEQRARLLNITPREPASPPTNLPGALPANAAENRPPLTFNTERPVPPPPPAHPVAPAKPYSTDPYREPVEETE